MMPQPHHAIGAAGFVGARSANSLPDVPQMPARYVLTKLQLATKPQAGVVCGHDVSNSSCHATLREQIPLVHPRDFES